MCIVEEPRCDKERNASQSRARAAIRGHINTAANREGRGSPSQELTKPSSLPRHDTGLVRGRCHLSPTTTPQKRIPQKQGLMCIGHRSIWPRCGVLVFRLLLTRAIPYFIERSSRYLPLTFAGSGRAGTVCFSRSIGFEQKDGGGQPPSFTSCKARGEAMSGTFCDLEYLC